MPDSRSLVICADLLGLTGTGGGGMGDSRVRSVLCSSFRDDSCCFSGRELEDVIMALEVGSIVMGRSVNVSVSSILGGWTALSGSCAIIC